MITEDELFNLGFRVFGLNDNDPYYQVFLKNKIFGIKHLSGHFENDKFVLRQLNKKYDSINELKTLFLVCDIKIDEDTDKYGKKEYLLDQEIIDKQVNTKTSNELINDLLRISNDKRKLPIVIQAPNTELFPPQIKMLTDDGTIYGSVYKMILTS